MVDSRSSINRRKLLKKTGASSTAGLILASQTSTADPGERRKESQLHVNDLLYVRTVLKYEGHPGREYQSEPGMPGHLVDAEEGVITLTTDQPSQFRDIDSISVFRGDLTELPANHGGREHSNLVSDIGFDGLQMSEIGIDGPLLDPEFIVDRKDGGSVVVKSEGDSHTVEAGGQGNLRLSPREVTTEGQPYEVTPVLKTRNYGVLDVYGDKEWRVLPKRVEGHVGFEQHIQKIAAQRNDRAKAYGTDRFFAYRTKRKN